MARGRVRSLTKKGGWGKKNPIGGGRLGGESGRKGGTAFR